jgi:RNA-binding protein
MATPAKLSGKQARHLRALAHPLKPIIQIGKNGFTEAARSQVDRALLDHELIKIRIMPECPDELSDVLNGLGEHLSAHIAQTIGATIVAYRPHPQEPKIQLPKRK